MKFAWCDRFAASGRAFFVVILGAGFFTGCGGNGNNPAYEYLPGWKRLFTKLEGFFEKKFENIKEKSGVNFWVEMRDKIKK